MSVQLALLNMMNLTRSSPCVRPSIDDFPSDFMTQHQRQSQGGVAFHFLIVIYMTTALSLVCNVYFVPSLQKITNKLHMSSDVAGATLMSIGTSSPELFTALIAVLITDGEIGPGAILGSLQFNVLFIVGICGLFAGSVLPLRSWPLLRDSFAFLLSVMALMVVIWDKKIYWYEALALVIMYLLYVLIIYFNSTFRRCFNEFTGSEEWVETDIENGSDEKSLLLENDYVNSTQMANLSRSEKGEKEEEQVEITDQFDDSPFSVPQGFFYKTLWLVSLPITCLLYVTIPDCRKERWENWYLFSFIMSVLWVAIFTYVLIWMVVIIGFTLEIPDVVMSFTLLAATTSIPEAISSLIVARQGEGDMAVSHAVGSNTFDILLCLGVPWLLKTTIVANVDYVVLEDVALIYTSFLLIGSALIVVVFLKVNGWHLNKCLGISFSVFYLGFTGVSITFAYLFGDNKPMC